MWTVDSFGIATLFGVGCLAISLVPVFGIMRTARSRNLRRAWCYLALMITGFILGYAALSVLLPRDINYVLLNLIGAVLVMGSVFVLSVAVLALSTAKDISRLVHLEQEVIVEALTGIYNSRFFDEQFDREIGRASRTGTNLGLLIVDVDLFKEINDTHGHAIGDRVLAVIASILSEEIRNSDIPVRYGGDEFAIIAPGGDGENVAGLADRLCRKIGSTFVACSEGCVLPP